MGAGGSSASAGGSAGSGGAVGASPDASVAGAAGDAGADAPSDVPADASSGPLEVLVFSKTEGFRHASIPAAVSAVESLAPERGWSVRATEDALLFEDAILDAVDVVVFLLTTGDVLDAAQQAAFERFIRRGGGFVGIHAAADTEYDWPFYGGLVGAYFLSHPDIQDADLRVERPGHSATHTLPPTWRRTDEWYNFTRNPRADVTVLVSIDEASYRPGDGAMGDHPVSWYHGYEGGRAFYTALGHTSESYSEPAFLEHIAGGIDWAGGRHWAATLFVDLDGVMAPGRWHPHEPGVGFDFVVEPGRLRLIDESGANQHLTRSGVAFDGQRQLVYEGLFTITGSSAGSSINSFCFNFGISGPDGDSSPIDTWGMNLDVALAGPGGVMKTMGFVDGVFESVGERSVPWATVDVEYLLRVEWNTRLDGSAEDGTATVSVLEEGVVRERFETDYRGHSHQPGFADPLRLGANGHGTDWSLRSVRAYYLDGPAR